MPTSTGVKVQANGTALPTRNVSAAPADADKAAVASTTRQIGNARTYARMASSLRPLQPGLAKIITEIVPVVMHPAAGCVDAEHTRP